MDTQKATTSFQTTSKPNSTKAQGKSFMPNVETMSTKFVFTCHQCDIKGHIRPHYPILEIKHVHSQFITSRVKPKHPKIVQSRKFIPICHYCGMISHIRPYCHKLNMISSSHAYNQPRNQYERLENHIRVLTMHMNRFVSKPMQIFINHGKKENHNTKARTRITLTPHEFIKKSNVTVMWMRKFDLESLRTPKKFVGKHLIE